MAGYSSKPLLQKLGIKSGIKILVINAPEQYWKDLGPLPTGVEKSEKLADFIHFFSKDKTEYQKRLPKFKKRLKPTGMLWVSWPKKASKVATNLDEKEVRDFALKNGLVDIKVCAVDETWSGLKLVIPVKDRKNKNSKVRLPLNLDNKKAARSGSPEIRGSLSLVVQVARSLISVRLKIGCSCFS